MSSALKIARCAAAAVCAAAVAVSAVGLHISNEGFRDTAPFSDTPQSLIASAASDTGFAEALSGGGLDDKSENNNDNNEKNTETESRADLSASDLSQPSEERPSGGGERYYYDNNNEYSGYRDADTVLDSAHDGGTDSGKTDADKDDSEGKNQLVDDESRGDTPGNRPEDGSETDEEYFTTSIKDGETVDSELYEFTVTHLNKKLTVKRVEVRVNGSAVPFSGSVVLSHDNGGKNTVRIAVTYTDKDGKVIAAYREYTVYLKEKQDSSEQPSAEPQLQTDLYSHTRSDKSLSFFAYMSGEVRDVKMTVYFGNTKLKADGSEYSCTLSTGLNSLRIKATYTYEGERLEIYREFEIRVIEETTEETAPYLMYHNVPETVKGSAYTLDLAPRDHNGGKLYYNNLFVRFNGIELTYKWDGEYTSYLLEVQPGYNSLDIRVTDNEGRYTDYSFTVTGIAAQNGDVIGTATIEMDAAVLGLGTIMPQMQFDIRQGESAAESIDRALREAGFEISSTGSFDTGYYIARLSGSAMAQGAQIPDELRVYLETDNSVHFTDSSDPDSLGERDFTTASGWMISVNGHYTSYGLSDMNLKDGDILRLRFTLAYGKDIGGYVGEEPNYDICY